MTITLDLKPEEELILAAQAEAQGVTVETVWWSHLSRHVRAFV